jgi:proline iminopeptidase
MMRQLLKRLALALALLLALMISLGIILYIRTDGTYPVLATVSDDPSLPRVTVNGRTFHAESFGDARHPVVIVVHGGPGGDYRSLLGLQELADRYFVAFYDQRGAGLSERVPAQELTLQSSLQDLDAFVDLYGGGRPVMLIGHSWGGILVSAYLSYAPAKVAKAILAEPGYLNAAEFKAWDDARLRLLSNPEYGWLGVRTGFEAQHVAGPDSSAIEDYLNGTMVHAFANLPSNAYHCPGKPWGAPAWRWGATAGTAIISSATPADLDTLSGHAATFHKPVLFLAGQCDTWIGAELQAKHVALYPNARLLVISRAGHDMFWDNPQEAIPAVRVFLGE